MLLKYFGIKKVFQTQIHIISFHFVMHYSFGELLSTRTSVSKGQNLKKRDHYAKYSKSYSTSTRYFLWQITNVDMSISLLQIHNYYWAVLQWELETWISYRKIFISHLAFISFKFCKYVFNLNIQTLIGTIFKLHILSVCKILSFCHLH